MHTLEPSGADFLSGAKARSVAERTMPVSAEQLFATLEDPQAWSEFFPAIRRVDWTSPKPFRVGTTRTVTLVGGIRLDEVFWMWESGRRMGFAITAASTSVLRGLVETYDIVPLGDRGCRLRWEMALALNGPLRRVEPSMAPTLHRTQVRLMKRLERVARRVDGG